MSLALKFKQLDYINPETIFACVAKLAQPIFLDSSMYQEHYGRYSFITFAPLITFIPAATSFAPSVTSVKCFDSFAHAKKEFEQILQVNTIENNDLPPFIGGLVGYFSYELGYEIWELNSKFDELIPSYVLGLYNKVFAFDHLQQQLHLIVSAPNGFALDLEHELKTLEEIYYQACSENMAEDATINNYDSISASFDADEYYSMLAKARQDILAGQFYEINLANCFKTTWPKLTSKLKLYQKLRTINPAPFSAYLDYSQLFNQEFAILSATPERFLKIDNQHVEARPIKGTIKRVVDKSADDKLIEELANSTKNRAENVMIVDLLRNDLGRVCVSQSISVSKLCGIESYTNLHHMVSVIEGELLANKSYFDLLISAFPGGSITGAPKIRAMEKINQLEQEPRGIYCGSIGYFSFNHKADLNIAIRTICITQDELRFYAGGAITLGSDFTEEYAELYLKAEKIFSLFK